MDTGEGLGLKSKDKIKRADVVSGGNGMKIVVRISDRRESIIQPAFMFFQNQHRAYSTKKVPNDVPGVLYRTDPKERMATTVMSEWLCEA